MQRGIRITDSTLQFTSDNDGIDGGDDSHYAIGARFMLEHHHPLVAHFNITTMTQTMYNVLKNDQDRRSIVLFVGIPG